MVLTLRPCISGEQEVRKPRRSVLLLLAAWLGALQACSQYSYVIVPLPLKARTVYRCDSTVLLLVNDAPLADGWLMTGAQVEDDRLVGTVQRAHPLAVAQLEHTRREMRNTRVLYDLPERFLLVHVADPVLADLVPGQSFALPLNAAEDTRRIRQSTDGRIH